jgi:hypothetical protein
VRLKLTGALIGVLVLAVGVVAYANPISDTEMTVKGSATPTKSGTKKKPKSLKVVVNMTQKTKSGTGQPTTTKGFKIVFPKEWYINAKKWPKKSRCDDAAATRAQSISGCPKGSLVGTGTTTALVANGAITSTLKVTAAVVKDGDIGFFIDTDLPIPIKEFLPTTLRGRTLNIEVPDHIRNTAAGKSGITVLNNTLKGSARIKGKKRGLIESYSCKKKKWTVKFSNVAEDGTLTTNITGKCRK